MTLPWTVTVLFLYRDGDGVYMRLFGFFLPRYLYGYFFPPQICFNTVGFYFLCLCLPLTGGPLSPALNLWLATPCELRNEITRLFGINYLNSKRSGGEFLQGSSGSKAQELSACKESRHALAPPRHSKRILVDCSQPRLWQRDRLGVREGLLSKPISCTVA